jgi:hypothetical protein
LESREKKSSSRRPPRSHHHIAAAPFLLLLLRLLRPRAFRHGRETNTQKEKQAKQTLKIRNKKGPGEGHQKQLHKEHQAVQLPESRNRHKDPGLGTKIPKNKIKSRSKSDRRRRSRAATGAAAAAAAKRRADEESFTLSATDAFLLIRRHYERANELRDTPCPTPTPHPKKQNQKKKKNPPPSHFFSFPGILFLGGNQPTPQYPHYAPPTPSSIN